jgi:hypothetical protein
MRKEMVKETSILQPMSIQIPTVKPVKRERNYLFLLVNV